MSQIVKKFIGDNEVGAVKIRLENNTALRGRNAANNADVDVLILDSSNNVNIYDGQGNPVVDCGTKQLFDVSANESVDWGGRRLLDQGALVAINWEDDLTVYKSILSNDPGNLNIGSAGSIFNSLYVSDISDSNGSVIDVEDRLLKNSSNVSVIDFANANIYSLADLEIRGDGTNARDLVFREANNTAAVRLKSPDTLTAEFTLTLPEDAGSAGEILSSDGSGNLVWVADSGGATAAVETFTLGAGDITNQYITLANAPVAGSVHFIVKGGAPTLEGAAHDYTVTGTQIDFENDLATGGPAALVAGDIVQVKYMY